MGARTGGHGVAFGVDHAPQIASGPGHAVCVPPKVGQLAFVPSDHEQRRPRADLLLPALTGALVVLTQAKVGERGVQTLADDLSTAQLDFIDDPG